MAVASTSDFGSDEQKRATSSIRFDLRNSGKIGPTLWIIGAQASVHDFMPTVIRRYISNITIRGVQRAQATMSFIQRWSRMQDRYATTGETANACF